MSDHAPPALPDGPPPAGVLTPDPAAHGYPRPQLVRDGWTSLNGRWEFALDRAAAWRRPDDVVWDRTIVVPFAPETAASGVADPGFYNRVWYRRASTRPPSPTTSASARCASSARMPTIASWSSRT